jgi:ribosomal-protein-alanine N-acetyltransferase
MSALLNDLPRYRRMSSDDLDDVIAIENNVYPHPWTRGNFVDSLNAGYHAWIAAIGRRIIGYSIVMIGAEEAHLLNLSIAAHWQRRGIGRQLLTFMRKLAADYGARRMFLEVRPSNVAGLGLYADAGFTEIAIRRHYYPAGQGREDALVMSLQLQ